MPLQKTICCQNVKVAERVTQNVISGLYCRYRVGDDGDRVPAQLLLQRHTCLGFLLPVRLLLFGETACVSRKPHPYPK